MPKLIPVDCYKIREGFPILTKKQFHGTTYLEYEIPKSLEKKLSKIVEKRLKQFYKECNCDRCKQDRKLKNK